MRTSGIPQYFSYWLFRVFYHACLQTPLKVGMFQDLLQAMENMCLLTDRCKVLMRLSENMLPFLESYCS